MTIERIASQLNLNTGDRFIILYGTNTHDSFCTPDLRLQDIEQVLHQHLKANGFQRIVFYGGSGNLYFLDTESRNLALPQSNAISPVAGEMRTASDATVSRKRRLLKKINSNSPNNSNTSTTPQTVHTQRGQIANNPLEINATTPRCLPDIECLSLFNNFVQDIQHKSAIIFTNAEDLTQFTARRQLYSKMVEWAKLLPNNPNRCILISHHRDREELQSFCEGLELTFLPSLIGNKEQSNSNIIQVESPTDQELTALQHYFRLKHQKPLDWETFKQLSSWLAVENKTLNHWYAEFKLASELSVTEGKKRGWFSADVSHEPALERLEKMIGLDSVKNAVKRRMQSLKGEKIELERGISTKPPRLHLVFKGNPGTGKTTVARLIGEIYRDLGLLTRGHVIEVSGNDLIAGYRGQSAIETNKRIEEALNGVLFIDEIDSLNGESNGGNDFEVAVKKTLLKRMEDESHRLAVIIAGYPSQVDEFIKSDAGFKRRFATEIIFEDYKPDELMSIFSKQLAQVQGKLTPDLERNLLHLFTQLYQKCDESFENAGLVENLFAKMRECRFSRIDEENLDHINEPFTIKDIPSQYQVGGKKDEPKLEQLLQKLDSLIGLNSIKQTIKEIVETEQANLVLKEAGLPTEETETRHFIFTGNPGTGKTTVAQLIGQIFQCLGLLKRGHFVNIERPREQLIAQYEGQTATKVTKVIESALDGVLFIDEAYSLSRYNNSSGGADFGQEAIDTLTPMLESQRDCLIVILAGYSQEMKDFMQKNSGLNSRFPYQIEFPDYLPSELLAIFLSFTQQNKRFCPDNVRQVLLEKFTQMYNHRYPKFGNGREVRNLYETMVRRQKSRILRDKITDRQAMMTFTLSDVPN